MITAVATVIGALDPNRGASVGIEHEAHEHSERDEDVHSKLARFLGLQMQKCEDVVSVLCDEGSWLGAALGCPDWRT